VTIKKHMLHIRALQCTWHSDIYIQDVVHNFLINLSRPQKILLPVRIYEYDPRSEKSIFWSCSSDR